MSTTPDSLRPIELTQDNTVYWKVDCGNDEITCYAQGRFLDLTGKIIRVEYYNTWWKRLETLKITTSQALIKLPEGFEKITWGGYKDHYFLPGTGPIKPHYPEESS